MPELPEVETVRRGLERRLVGRSLSDVEVTGLRTVRRTSPGALVAGLDGVTVLGVERRGKYLVLRFDEGARAMIHLRMSGQVLISGRRDPRPAHTHVVMSLSDDAERGRDEEVRFVDPRTFGEVVAFRETDAAVLVPELDRLGWDPLLEPEAMTPRRWRALLAGRRRQLKALLLDQHPVAGIGNIYSDEILHRARLRPGRRSDDLSAQQARRLLGAIGEVLAEAVAHGGSSLRDAQYVDVDGRQGGYQAFHRVVDKEGRWCGTCERARIRRSVAAGRSSYWCPWCQR